MTFDTREWVAAARELFQTSSRTAVDFTNGQGLKVASLALRETTHADGAKIERELGAIGRSVSFKTLTSGKNTGKTRTVRGGYNLASQDTLGHRILTARHAVTGSFGVRGNTLDDKVQSLIRARKAASHFVRSGWIPAIRALSAVIRKKPAGVGGNSRQGARLRGQPKGNAKPARFSLRSLIICEIVNTALNKIPVHPETKGNPMKPAMAGLQKALNLSARDMIEELKRRLDPDFKKVSAK